MLQEILDCGFEEARDERRAVFRGTGIAIRVNCERGALQQGVQILHSIGFKLNLLWGSFYDDFPILSQRCLADTTLECAISLLKLLGFAFSEHKLKPFADRATVLGVEVDLAGVAMDDVKVRNKPRGVEEIDVAVQSLLEKGTATASECSKIIGRLQICG